jgi:hypothetical protein
MVLALNAKAKHEETRRQYEGMQATVQVST